jgi:phosphoglycerate dehydrogenase-like enzyme
VRHFDHLAFAERREAGDEGRRLRTLGRQPHDDNHLVACADDVGEFHASASEYRRRGGVPAPAAESAAPLHWTPVSKRRVLVTFSPSREMRDAFGETLDPVAQVTYLPDLRADERAEAVGAADAVIGWSIADELGDELAQLHSVGVVQLLSAGLDHVPFDQIPPGVPVASNAGAYSDPMAEHVLAMALALAKRLPQQHAALASGEFDQETLNREIRDSLVGVLGFGGIGKASAKLFSALGARIHALNRSGQTDAQVDQIGTLDDLDDVLRAADVVVISLPLTRATRALISERELSLMKSDAILVNVARGAILDEDALYEHLRRNPSFSAGIDAWWEEPLAHDSFNPRRPFLDLPNVIGSPHNSAITVHSWERAAWQAAANVARYLRGEHVQHLADRTDYIE